MWFGAADGENDQHQQTTVVLVFTLGIEYNEFGYHEHPATKSLDCNAKKFCYIEHSLKTNSSFCIFTIRNVVVAR